MWVDSDRAVADQAIDTLRAALDEVELGIILLDNDLNVQFVNRAFLKIYHLADSTRRKSQVVIAFARFDASITTLNTNAPMTWSHPQALYLTSRADRAWRPRAPIRCLRCVSTTTFR